MPKMRTCDDCGSKQPISRLFNVGTREYCSSCCVERMYNIFGHTNSIAKERVEDLKLINKVYVEMSKEWKKKYWKNIEE